MLVTFEGVEGAGKSRLSDALADYFNRRGVSVVQTREPGAGELGRKIRELLLSGNEVPALSEIFLFLADRASHVTTIIKPALAEGKLVLCDRFADSTIVYQGYARGFDIDWLRGLNRIATDGITPDLTLLLDLDPEVGIERQHKRDRLDSEPVEFHQRVRAGFLKEAERDSSRWVIIDAQSDFEAVFEIAKSTIERKIL